jgi:transposase InsO family protein
MDRSPNSANWTIGAVFEWQGSTYRMVAIDWNNLTLEAQELATSIISRIPLSVIWGMDGSLPITEEFRDRPDLAGSTVAGLPDHYLAKADLVIEVVETTRQRLAEAESEAHFTGQTFHYTPTLKHILKTRATPVGLTTYYKYRDRYETYAGDRAQIAASFRRATFNQTTMSAAQLHLMDQIILRYGTRQPPRQTRTLYNIAQSVLTRTGGRWIDPDRCSGDIPQNIVQELLDSNIPMAAILSQPEKSALLVTIELPSESWFYTYSRWFQTQPDQGQAAFIQRYGAETWEREMQVFDTFAHQATMPLQYVFADHWLVDVFTVDEATRQQRSRLWLTALIDAYSRCILGIALLDEDPCIWSIQTALQHAIWVKTSHETLGIAGTWSCFGIPQQLFLDNAWAHHSHSLEDLARAISQNGQYPSIDLVFRPPYKGRYGALIERYFGNLSARMKAELPGAIVSSQRADRRRAAEQACLLYEDVSRFIHQEILAYQHTPHRELNGLTPHEKWQAWMEMSLPQVPPPTATIQRLFWRMEAKPRRITRMGVNAFGMQYTAPELKRAERVNRQGQRVRYHFRYDPMDISRLALFKDGHWVCDVFARPLRLPDGSYRTISLAQHKLARQAAQAAGEESRDWLRYINEQDDLYRQRRLEQRQANQRTASPTQSMTDTTTMTNALEQLADEKRGDELSGLLTEFLSE